MIRKHALRRGHALAGALTAAVIVSLLAAAPAFAGVVLADGYAQSNQDSGSFMYSGSWSGVGQSFTAVAGTLDSATFYLRKVGAPTGNMYAKLYAHSGAYGSTSMPTGVALATSAPLDVSTVQTGVYALWSFAFDNSVSLTNGAYYCIVLEYSGGSAGNYVAVGIDTTVPTHAGNCTGNWNNSVWYFYPVRDVIFGVYVTADTDGPAITASVAEGGSYLAPLTVTFSATDAVEGPVTPSATLNGNPFASGSSILAPGSYTLVITASDSVPNSSVSTIHFTVALPDTTGPAITASVAEGGSYLAPLTVTFSATDAVEGPVTPSATLNGNPFASGSSILAPGSYTLVITASDSVPNSSVSTIHFTVAAPVVVSTPASSVWSLAIGIVAAGAVVLSAERRRRHA